MTISFLRKSDFEWQDKLIAILMAAFSGMLHLILLLTPLPPEKPPAPEPEEELTEEIIPIKSLIAAGPPPSAKPAPKAAPPPAPKPQTPQVPQPPAVPVPQRVTPSPPAVQNSEAPAPSPESTPVEQPSATTPQETPAPATTLAPPTPPPPAAPVTSSTGGASAEQVVAFLNSLQSKFLEAFAGSAPEEIAQMQEQFATLPFDNLAVDAAPFGGGGALRAGALGSLALPRINLGNATEKVEAILTALGFNQIEEAGQYGSSQLMKAKNAEGAEIYVSLVKQKGLGSGVFVVLWPQDPNKSP